MSVVTTKRNDKSHDRGRVASRLHGSSRLDRTDSARLIHPKIEAGKFLVCDSENVCFFTRSLYLAEEQLEEMELGYRFPYSTNFRKAPA